MADGPPYAHTRNQSNGTQRTSGNMSGASALSWRRHPEYDRVSVDSETGSTRSARAKNPIPNPHITIKSEYPTLTRSRQQQNLTCLVTVEVPEGKWQPDIEDLRNMRPRLSQTVERNAQHRHGPSNASNRSAKQIKSPQGSTAPGPPPPRMPEPLESEEELQRVTEDLHSRVDNWHGLDFSRYVNIFQHYHHFLTDMCKTNTLFVVLAICCFMILSESGKMACRGRSWNVIFLLKCSSVSRKGPINVHK